MDSGVVLLALILLAAGSVGFVGIMSANSAPVVDTFGNTHDAQTNATHALMTNTSAPVAEFGGGMVLAIAIIFVAGTLFAVLGLILYYRSKNGGYGNR